MSHTGAVLTAVYLTAMMFSIGIGLRAGRPTKERRRVGLHLRALLLDVVLIPAVAVLLTRTLHLSGNVAFALLIVAASPGGRFSPQLARDAHGDVSFATTQVLVISKIAVFSAPLTMGWLLGLHDLHVAGPPMMVKGFLLQMLPLYVGRAIARRRGDLAERIDGPLRKIVGVCTIVVLAVFLWHSGFASVEVLGDRGWLAVGGVALASTVLGVLLAGRDPAMRRTLIAGALSRNVALALLLAGLAFPGSHVQLAVFGVWWLLVGVGYLLARISGRIAFTGERRSLASARGPQWT